MVWPLSYGYIHTHKLTFFVILCKRISLVHPISFTSTITNHFKTFAQSFYYSIIIGLVGRLTTWSLAPEQRLKLQFTDSLSFTSRVGILTRQAHNVTVVLDPFPQQAVCCTWTITIACVRWRQDLAMQVVKRRHWNSYVGNVWSICLTDIACIEECS